MTDTTPWKFPIENLNKVKDWIPAPTQCHYCFSEVTIKTHMEVYGKNFGNWPYMYQCTCCDASVGIHKGTNVPLGYLADKNLRSKRIEVKASFFKLKEDYNLSTKEAYSLLAGQMKYSKKNCHFGMFLNKDLSMAKQAIDKLNRKLRRVNELHR